MHGRGMQALSSHIQETAKMEAKCQEYESALGMATSEAPRSMHAHGLLWHCRAGLRLWLTPAGHGAGRKPN
jgi:hypothetical protein